MDIYWDVQNGFIIEGAGVITIQVVAIEPASRIACVVVMWIGGNGWIT
jgi:hypothetical protein